MDLNGTRPAWYDRAACRGMPLAMFFPPGRIDTRGREGTRSGANDEARATCKGCPVRLPCAEAGRDNQYGMWGGLSPSQRGFGSHQRAKAEAGPPAAWPEVIAG